MEHDFLIHIDGSLSKLTVTTDLFRHHVLDTLKRAFAQWIERSELGKDFFITCGHIIDGHDLFRLNERQLNDLTKHLTAFGITGIQLSNTLKDQLLPEGFLFAGEED